MPKRTLQRNKRRRSKRLGFFARMATAKKKGRVGSVIASRRRKGRHSLSPQARAK